MQSNPHKGRIFFRLRPLGFTRPVHMHDPSPIDLAAQLIPLGDPSRFRQYVKPQSGDCIASGGRRR